MDEEGGEGKTEWKGKGKGGGEREGPDPQLFWPRTVPGTMSTETRSVIVVSCVFSISRTHVTLTVSVGLLLNAKTPRTFCATVYHAPSLHVASECSTASELR